VNVVGRQAICPDLRPGSPRGAGDQGQVGAVVAVLEEHLFPTIAALGYVMRKTWDHEAGHQALPRLWTNGDLTLNYNTVTAINDTITQIAVKHPRWEPYAAKPHERFHAVALSDGRLYSNPEITTGNNDTVSEIHLSPKRSIAKGSTCGRAGGN
jgi:hypothetical protein